ncbi:MAG TPA: cytochrome c3 family protein [Terriglobia bacterium]|nr:cytochrome c3 family protein [Terriglobia bacterium]
MKGQATRPDTNAIFSPAHGSISEAISHFFGYRPEPVQPIAFPHNVHVQDVELACMDCHISAARGPQASIPDIRTCWNCHATTATDRAEIQKMKGYFDKGQDIPWQRVWGWVEESHVRFNHAPHILAKVDCATCHGDVAQMTVATREIQHTMEFCVTCHKEKGASNDCVTCHY